MTWEPVNLAKLEDRPPTLPTVGGAGLVYPGKRHLFSGPPESAKTLAAYAIALDEIRQDGQVLLIDFEMGPWDARDRLREMGATDDELERFLYVEPETRATPDVIEALVAGWPLTLAIVDAAAGAYGMQGLDDNARRDVEAFAQLYVQGFWLRTVATIVLDHVGKNADKRGAFAIGSERKVGGVDVHLGFEPVVKIARGGRGLYKITTHKDRLGHLQRPKAGELELRSDPSTHRLEWTFKQPEAPTADKPWKPTVLMERVSRFLELTSSAASDEVDGISRGKVETSVRGTADFVRRALDELVVGGYVSESTGTRGSRRYRSVKPYRQDDLVGTSSAPRRDEVDSSTLDLVVAPSSLEGRRDDEVGAAGVDEFPVNGSGWLHLLDESTATVRTHARPDCRDAPPHVELRPVLIPYGRHAPSTWERCDTCGGARPLGQMRFEEDDW